MTMKIKITHTPKPIPRPKLNSAVVLKKVGTDKQLLVLLCPTPRGNFCMFVGEGLNTYLPEAEWEAYVPTQYTFVHEGPLSSMEVTFNA